MTDNLIPAADAAQLPATLPGSPPADPPSPDAGAQPAAGIPSEDAGPAHGYDLTGINIAQENSAAVDGWGAVMEFNQIPPELARSTVEYFAGGGLRREMQQNASTAPAHNYRIPDSFGFTDADLPNLTRALNFFHRKGASEEHVWAMLRNYQDATRQAQKSRARGPIQRQDWNQPAQRSSGAGDQAELAKIEAFMRSNRAAYFKDKNMQARYRQLLEKRG